MQGDAGLMHPVGRDGILDSAVDNMMDGDELGGNAEAVVLEQRWRVR